MLKGFSPGSLFSEWFFPRVAGIFDWFFPWGVISRAVLFSRGFISWVAFFHRLAFFPGSLFFSGGGVEQKGLFYCYSSKFWLPDLS